MSVAMTAAVWKLDLPPTTKMVMLRLADFVNREGRTAWPSVELLAYECRINRRTIQRALRDLESLGLIEAQGGRRRYRSVIYAIYPERGVKLSPFVSRREAAYDRPQERQIFDSEAAHDPVDSGNTPPEPEEGSVKAKRKLEAVPPQPPATLSRGAARALKGSNRKRDQDALAAELPEAGPDDRYFRGRYGSILRRRLEEGERDAM